MTITAAIILFSVTWFMIFLMILPFGHRSQAEDGHVVPGTHKSAPADNQVGRKARITTLIAAVLFVAMYLFITQSGFTIRDLDRMLPDIGQPGYPD